MRKFIHLCMAYCLLQVTSCALISDLSAAFQEGHPPATNIHDPTSIDMRLGYVDAGYSSGEEEEDNGETAAEVLKYFAAVDYDPESLQPKEKSSNYFDLAKNTLETIRKKSYDTAVSTVDFVTSHPAVWIPLAIVAFITVFFSFISILCDMQQKTFLGSSIAPNFSELYRWLTIPKNHHPVLTQTPDYSQASIKYHTEMIRRDGLQSTEYLNQTDSVQEWFNNAQNIMSMIAVVVLQYRHKETPGVAALNEVIAQSDYVFKTHRVRLVQDIVCEFDVASQANQDRLHNCREERRPVDWSSQNVTSDAQVWFLRKSRAFERWRLWTTHILPHTGPINHRYVADADTTPNPEHPDHVTTQRRLMQAQSGSGSGLSVEESIQQELMTNSAFINKLSDVVMPLYYWNPSDSGDLADLVVIAKQMFSARQWVMTANGVQCDLLISPESLSMGTCAEGTANTFSSQGVIRFIANGEKFESVQLEINQAALEIATPYWLMTSDIAKQALLQVLKVLANQACSNGDSGVRVLQSEVARLYDQYGVIMHQDVGVDVRIRKGQIDQMAAKLGEAPEYTGDIDAAGCGGLTPAVEHRWDAHVWLARSYTNRSQFDWPQVTVEDGVDLGRMPTATQQVSGTDSWEKTPSHSEPVPVTPSETIPETAEPAVLDKPKYVYWTRGNSEIYRANLFPNGTSFNAALWVKDSVLGLLYSFWPDLQNGYLYGVSSGVNIWDITNTTPPAVSNKQELVQMGSFSPIMYKSPDRNLLYVYKNRYDLFKLELNQSNPVHILNETKLGRINQRFSAGLFVDELKGRIYMSGSSKIEVGTFPELTNWTKLNATIPGVSGSIYGIYIYGDTIYWNQNNKIYKGDINRESPDEILNIEVVTEGEAGFRVGYGGVVVQ